MPCDDTTSSITVNIGFDDRLIDYRYEKMTCGKQIGASGDYHKFCVGKPIETIVELTFPEVLKQVGAKGSEDEFLMYLEWKALREAIIQYMGLKSEDESNNYQIANILTDEGSISIEMIIHPPKEMPIIIPCGEMEKR